VVPTRYLEALHTSYTDIAGACAVDNYTLLPVTTHVVVYQ